ncbi:MAG: hypothetical protein KC591_10165 [Gemmatimonadetes bacterium]|nr:hypothetical protein [Gemmatimonadota bacterium]
MSGAVGRVAFVTFAGLPHLDADDRPFADALRVAGVDVSPAVWSDPRVDWDDFDLLVLRSCWDYDRRPTEFRAWLDAREHGRTRVVNPVRALRWNLDKDVFLEDLAGRGVAIVPTRVVRPADPRRLSEVLADTDWATAVVKPAVSLNSNGTWRVDAMQVETPETEERFRRAMVSAPLLIQRYEPAIETDGEWSIVFLAGSFAHAVRKRPAPGDFRVQSEFGGRKERVGAPPAALLESAEQTLSTAEIACGERFTYARVDGVRAPEGFLLMELEVLDPSLYLEVAPASVPLARDAILALLG